MQNTNLNNKTILITGGTDPILASLANKMKEVVYCNCDDPLASNFFLNFKHLGLKELIATCYKSQNFRKFSAEEKNILSLYQAAKALCAYWCEMEFDKVSLLGDGIKNTDKNLRSKTDLLNRIKVALSGNVVLEMNVGEVYTNCKDDIQIAKEIAHEMCESYAMGEQMLVSAEDILEILNAVRDELKIFFTSSKTALLEAQKLLLENEKITKDELGAIFKKSLDSLE